MKVGRWLPWVGVTILVTAFISDWLAHGPQDKAAQSPGVDAHPIALWGSIGSVGHLKKVAPSAPPTSASGGELTRPQGFADESIVKAMGPTPTAIAATENEVQFERRQGASDDDIYRLRASAYSAEKATQLAEQERAEAAWNSRVQSYLAEKIRLTNSSDSANMGHQSTALQQLRNARFTAEEQKLLAANVPSAGPQLVLESDAGSP